MEAGEATLLVRYCMAAWRSVPSGSCSPVDGRPQYHHSEQLMYSNDFHLYQRGVEEFQRYLVSNENESRYRLLPSAFFVVSLSLYHV